MNKVNKFFLFFIMLISILGNTHFSYMSEAPSPVSVPNCSGSDGNGDIIISVILIVIGIIVTVVYYVKKDSDKMSGLDNDTTLSDNILESETKSEIDSIVSSNDSLDLPEIPNNYDKFLNFLVKHLEALNTVTNNIFLCISIVCGLLAIYLLIYMYNIFGCKDFVERIKLKYPKFYKYSNYLVVLIFWSCFFIIGYFL